jgi:hypothetical protein
MERMIVINYFSGVKQRVGYALFRAEKTVLIGCWAEQLTGVHLRCPLGQ